MDKLAGYGSDDDCEESPKHRKTEHATSYELTRNVQNKQMKQVDVNYEEVQMDLSEDSNNSDSSSKDAPTSRSDRLGSSKSPRNTDHRRNNDRDDERYNRDSPKYRDYKPRREDEEDRCRRRDDEEDRCRRRDDRDRYSSRGRNDDKYSREKHRDDRDRSYRSRRSSSRERRSRSPRRPDNRSSKRSNSRDRDVKSSYTRRYERPNKPEPEKIELEPSKPAEPPSVKPETDNKDRFYMPGITGRFKEQIERRKMLWQRKEPEKKDTNTPQPTTAGKVWQATTFAQDTDGKVANKFKRLMGIRDSSSGSKGAPDTLKKQEEMFSSMEAQYEVARTATHTMRGVGLGFSSFQR